MSTLRSCIIKLDQMTGKVTKEVMDALEQRNHEGKTPFFLAVEHNSEEIIEYMLDHF